MYIPWIYPQEFDGRFTFLGGRRQAKGALYVSLTDFLHACYVINT
jgi:hypothetical protein